MAVIGQVLKVPEDGWKRYDSIDGRFHYTGSWTDSNSVNTYGSSEKRTSQSGATVSFKFYGTKIRLMANMNPTFSDNITINIDDIVETFSMYNTGDVLQALYYEKNSLTLGIHTITITNNTSKIYGIDSIDIDSDGYLTHPILNQVDNLDDMQIGDCISCRYTALASGTAGAFSELGTCDSSVIPTTGTATPNGLFYFIKVGKGTLIADRVVQTNISWDVLNNAKYIEGNSLPFGTVVGCNFDTDSINASNLNIPISLCGTAILDTSNSKYGTKSLKISNGSYVNLGKDNSVKLNGGDFTIEAWVYVESGSLFIYSSMSTSTTYDGIPICYDSRGLLMNFPNSSANGWASPNLVLNSTALMNQWVHIAVERKNNTLTGYVNGVGGIPYNMPNEIPANRETMANIGGYGNKFDLGVGYINGYKFVKGKVLFGRNFTPSKLPITNFNDGIILQFRSLSGGCAYTDSNGNPSLTDKSLGAWPVNNEWDKYIVNSDLDSKITKGDKNIWNYNEWSWCKETGMSGIITVNTPSGANNTSHVIRKMAMDAPLSSLSTSIYGGFRPVLNYIESDIASEVIY